MPRTEVYAHHALLRRGDGGRAFLRIMRGFELTEAKERFFFEGLGERGYPAQVVWGGATRRSARSAAPRCRRRSASRSRPCSPPSTSCRRTDAGRDRRRGRRAGAGSSASRLAGSATLAGAVGDQLGLPALGEGDLDHVEVARGDSRLEHLARLLQHLADVVAGGDVDEGEHLDVRLGGDRGRLADGRVAGFGGALGVLLGEAGVVDEQVGVGGGGDRRRRGRGVAGDHDRAARPRLAPSPARAAPSPPTPRPPPRAAAPRRPALRRRRRRLAASGSKRPGPLLLDQRVAVGAHVVARLEGLDLVARRGRPTRRAPARPGRGRSRAGRSAARGWRTARAAPAARRPVSGRSRSVRS